MRKPNFKKAIAEFKDFYMVCYAANKKWTVVTTFVILIAIFDEIRAFAKGRGTLADIFDWALKYKDSLIGLF